MRQLRLLRESLRALSDRPLRSLLCVAAVAFGISAVFLANALGNGARQEVVRSMASLGADLIVVRPAESKRPAARKEIRGLVTTLRVEDYQRISELRSVANAAPAIEGVLKVRSDSSIFATKVLGTEPSFLRVRTYQLSRGRMFDEEEDRAARRVAVVGARVEAILFDGRDPVGEVVRIKGVAYEVVGVLRSKGVSEDGADNDNQILIPLRTAQRRVFNSRCLSTVFVSVRSPELLDPAEEQIRSLLRERHRLDRGDRPDDFAVQNQRKLLRAQQQTADSLSVLRSSLAGVALLLGGLGILGLMLVSVRERTAEIGLRLALGARQLDVFLQFLAEAVVLSLVGGIVGVTLGLLGAKGLSVATSWRAVPSVETGIQSFVAAAVLGLVFGVLPSQRAARLTPVEALAEE